MVILGCWTSGLTLFDAEPERSDYLWDRTRINKPLSGSIVSGDHLMSHESDDAQPHC